MGLRGAVVQGLLAVVGGVSLLSAGIAPAWAQDPTASARALNAQGLALIRQGKLAEAEKFLDQAAAICDGVLHGERFCVAGTSQNLASIAEQRGDFASAQRLLNRAATVTLAASGPDNRQYGVIELKLGLVLVHSQQFALAEAPLKAAVSVFSQSGAPPTALYNALVNLSDVFVRRRRPEEAAPLLDQALALCPTVAAAANCEPMVRTKQGVLLSSEGERAQAEALLRKAAALFRAAGRDDEADTALTILASRFLDVHEYEGAEAILKPVYDATLTRVGTSVAVLAGLEAKLAEIDVNTGRSEAAGPLIRSAMARVDAGAMKPLETGAVLMRLGRIQSSLGHGVEARPLLERALALALAEGPAAPPWRVEAECDLARLDTREERLTEAEQLYRKSVAESDAEGSWGVQASASFGLAETLIAERRFDEAEIILRALLQKVQAQPRFSPAAGAQVDLELAHLLNKTRRFKDAKAFAAQSVAHFQTTGARARDLAGPLRELGVAEEGLGNYADAASHLQVSITDAEQVLPVYVQAELLARQLLCGVFSDEGDFASEEACARELVARMRSSSGIPPREKMDFLTTLGVALFDQGKYTAAKETFAEALSTGESLTPNRDLAAVVVDLGQTDRALGDRQAAESALTRGVQLYAETAPVDDEVRIDASRRLGDLYADLGRYSNAEPLVKASADWFVSHYGPDHPRTALQLRSLGRLYLAAGRLNDAELALRKALAARQASTTPNLAKVAQSQSDLADLEVELGRYDAARALYQQSEQTERQARGVNHWWLGLEAHALARLDAAQGRLADAEGGYKRAAVLLEGGGDDARRDALINQSALGRLYLMEGRYDDATKALQASLTSQDTPTGVRSVDAVATLDSISAVERETGHYTEARTTLERSLNLLRAADGGASWFVAEHLAELAGLLAEENRRGQARQTLLQALVSRREAAGTDDPASYNFLIIVSATEVSLGDLADAQAHASQALAIARAYRGEGAPSIIAAMVACGDVARRQGRLKDAEPLLTGALAKAVALWGDGTPATLPALIALAGLDFDRQKFTDAEARLSEALKVARERSTPSGPLIVGVMIDLANVYLAEGQATEAEHLLLTAKAQLALQPTGPARTGTILELSLAKVYAVEGRATESAAAAAAAAALWDDPAPPTQQWL